MDSQDLLQCPYDKNHMIRPSRFPFHLVKCRENNKDAAKHLATCPFNARHRVPKKELELHMQTCENKCHLEPLPAFGEITREAEVKSKAEKSSLWQSPPCEENWEEDSPTEKQPVFVLKEYGNYQPYSSHETDKCTPSATARPSQGYNIWAKPKDLKPHPGYGYQGGISAAYPSEPGSSYETEWPRCMASLRSQGTDAGIGWRTQRGS